MDVGMSLYDDASRNGRKTHEPNGLPCQNRAVMSQDKMMKMRKTPGDLFAVFKDDLGQIHIEWARVEDYHGFVVREIIRRQAESFEFEEKPIDAMYLTGIVMISKAMGFSLDHFEQLLTDDGRSLYDSFGLCLWIEHNQHYFASPAQAEMNNLAVDRAELEAENEALMDQIA